MGAHDLVQGKDVYSEKTYSAGGLLLSEKYAGQDSVQIKSNLSVKTSFDYMIAAPVAGENEADLPDYSQRITHEGGAAARPAQRAGLTELRGRITGFTNGNGTEVGSVLKITNEKDFVKTNILEVYTVLRNIGENSCASQLYRFPAKDAGSRRRFSNRLQRNTNAKELCYNYAKALREAGEKIEFVHAGFKTLLRFQKKTVSVVRKQKRANGRVSTRNQRVAGQYVYTNRTPVETAAGNAEELKAACGAATVSKSFEAPNTGKVVLSKCADASVSKLEINGEVIYSKKEGNTYTSATESKCTKFMAEGASLLGFDSKLNETFGEALTSIKQDQEDVVANVDQAVDLSQAGALADSSAVVKALLALVF